MDKVESVKPTWELGVALGSQYLADYRGSKSYGIKAVPVPFFVYRGERFKIDRKGMRGDLIHSKAWELNVSAEVSLSGGNEDNALREGMPELESSFEMGPSLNIALDGNVDDDGWLLRLPFRGVFAASTKGVEYIGYVFNPKITFVNDETASGWRLSNSLGLNFGSELYHDYYYEVAPDYELTERPAYNAKAGFSGYYFKASASRRSGLWRYGASFRYDNLSSTDFAKNSPLVETNDYFAVSFLLARYFWASK